jgi:hypothetical protein
MGRTTFVIIGVNGSITGRSKLAARWPPGTAVRRITL